MDAKVKEYLKLLLMLVFQMMRSLGWSEEKIEELYREAKEEFIANDPAKIRKALEASNPEGATWT
jgi:hypothetical protein